MSEVGQRERITQKRVVNLLNTNLGYDYLGNWAARVGNSSIDEGLLVASLRARGYEKNLIARALDRLGKAAAVGAGHDLYEANREVYGLLRYGVKVKPGVGEQYETVWLIDWNDREANHFAVAEEVTVKGEHTKRPDIVIYVNGIALATLELKRSKVAVSEGIRQTIGNQSQDFIRPFFSTVQFVFAGNDVEGLRYGLIDTPEKYWLTWKEPFRRKVGPLDRALLQMCEKHRFLELIHDFIVFDSGVKKGPRHNQYFGVKAAQDRIAQREGGIIWHTQGSGKSLTMVWLAKWIRENQPNDPRVLLITDRTELDEQIEKVFKGVNEDIYRTSSGADLIATLNKSEQWLMCSLVHKFRAPDSDREDEEATAEFIRELNAKIPKNFKAKGNIFVFVDEAHRTQSGAMHDAMKQLLPEAMFIGFTGTPLLKSDKATSIETFGSFIHTYKFNEAVADGVVLDLRYEARNIDQHLTSPDRVDQWFEAKTQNMTDLSKAELKKRWMTMQKIASGEPRSRQIVNDILLDMELKPRLKTSRGNAMLVGESIYQACRLYELFCNAGFQGKCAIVTSYVPNTSDIAKERSGEGKTEKLRQYEIYRRMLADYFNEPADKAMSKVEQFEREVKRQFVDNPGQMKLLIVVDKLLTGFDAPSATYLYIDKKMQNHGLFQAICRVNRLDGDDKDYGYIVDYRDLFKSLESAIHDYTAEALDGYEKDDIEGLLTDRIKKAREDLDEALEQIRALVEPVKPPKDTYAYQQYFCAKDEGDTKQLKDNEPKRVMLYKAVSAVTSAYANIASDMTEAGYTKSQAAQIKTEVADYISIRTEVKLGAGENVDFKQYEAGMRYLLDTYIQADTSRVVATFEDKGLIELIVELGPDVLGLLPAGVRSNPQAVSETIVNNVRKILTDERMMNPKYYDHVSDLLTALIERRRKEAIDYENYLAELIELARKARPERESPIHTGLRALIDNLGDEPLAKRIDIVIREVKPHHWIDSKLKQRLVRNAIRAELPADFGDDEFDELMAVVKAHDEYH
ncbi:MULTISPECIES: type I restriction endonuclease subunit R [Gordonia]|uniref:type I restriction endonuclease subunit R n=1 Tax=Gordonia TaxID=2053 RepID=UPI001331AD5B|nr:MULTISPECIES: type I restriction endonuclease subunit R [Gordonia]KAF0971223.1 hypothetical protein BPODLACK_00406 [Gordonia sp. YY1]MCZ4651082.1 type I restriction endonuclease subunit R [Gordonia amicalis]